MNTQLVKANEDTELNTCLFTKQYYVLAGWSTTKDGDVVYKDNEKVKLGSDTTLYAKWVPEKITISFDPKGGTGKIDSIMADANNLVKLPKDTFTPPTGYHAAGWLDEESKHYKDEGEYQFVEDTALSADWDPNVYKIQFNPNFKDPKQQMYDEVLFYDEEQKLFRNAFLNPGHILLGWTEDEAGQSDLYLDEAKIMNLTAENDGVLTLYAQWNEDDRLTGTKWKMTISGTTVELDFSAVNIGEVAILLDGKSVVSGKYARNNEKLALFVKKAGLGTEVYAYISTDKKLVCFSKDSTQKVSDIDFKRNFGFPEGILN